MGYGAGTASILWPALAPVGSHRWPGKSIERISFSVRWCLSFQGLTPEKRRSRRREPGPRQLGTVACQGKALAVEVLSTEEQARLTECLRHLCDPIRPRAETRRTQAHPVPRGGFHKAGEGPAFGDSFPDFSSGRNRAQRSVPARLAGLNPDLGEGHSLKKRWKNLP